MPHNGNIDGRNIGTATREWDSGIAFNPRSNTYKLVQALLSQANRLDDSIDEVYHAHHIETAEGKELEQFGKLVNTPRKSGEPDDKYRTRVKAQFAQAKTHTDFDSFVQFCTSVLGTDVDNLEFVTNYSADPATVVLRADSAIFDAVSLTASEVVDILGGGVPAGHAVKVQESGTFRLKSDGDSDDASMGLTSDSMNTGGTLAADLE